MRKAIFLDRDGVINIFPGEGLYVQSWNDFRFMPEIQENIQRLRAAGFFLVMASNQAGVGRGIMTRATLDEIHTNMQTGLGESKLDALRFCPHHPDEGCPCRKPSPWMLQDAAKEFDIDLAASFMIGDSGRDIEMGRLAGCRTILCREKGREWPQHLQSFCPGEGVGNCRFGLRPAERDIGRERPFVSSVVGISCKGGDLPC